jgi:nicotinamidase-related amidase
MHIPPAIDERPPSVNIDAQPFPFAFELAASALVIIDMQRDFVEPGGFGASLGNDVSLLRAIIPACQRTLTAWRTHGGLVVHTREAHRADLSDCPPAKRDRGNPSLRIGDVGPMGRVLVAGEPGNQIIAELAPVDGEIVIDKPGKGAFYATGLHEILQARGISHLMFMGVTTEVCVQTSMREANDRGYEALLLEDCTESYFPAFKAATLAMVHAQGGIVGWTAPSNYLLQALAH